MLTSLLTQFIQIINTQTTFVVELEKLDYRLLLQQHLDQTGKAIKPVQRRKNSLSVPKDILCPKCQAPHDYLYNNNGGKGQFQCKICQTNFNHKK